MGFDYTNLPFEQAYWITWLEQQFPERFDSYKVVFSPLTGVSHRTQQFHYFDQQWFLENVMFVSAPAFYDPTKDASLPLRQGLAAGIVLTEIVHNYINPITEKFGKQIDSIFPSRAAWTASGGDAKLYGRPKTSLTNI